VKLAFSHVHPTVVFLYYVGLIMMSMTLLHPVFLATAVLLLLILNMVHGNGKTMKTMMVSSIVLAIIIAVANPLLTHRGSTILFYMSDNPVTLEAITYGCIMALSFLSVAFAFVSYNSIVSSHKILYLFSRISPKVALLTMISTRFVPLFIRRLAQIQLVQKTKGVQTNSGSLKTRAKSGMKLLSVLLVCSLEEAFQIADSMQARGFGTVKRSTYIRYRTEQRDWGILLHLLISFSVCIGLGTGGAGVLTVYPKLQSITFHLTDWISYLSFILFISTPLLLEGREWVWWHMQK
jgi:energy-coupling factor transport system permease protein